MNIAFFDFDGTITRNDSLLKFIRFAVGDLKFLIGLTVLSPMLITYKLKLIPNYRAKQMMLSYYFKDMAEKKFIEAANRYSEEHIDTIIRPSAMEKIKWHQSKEDSVVIVSASLECWLRPWCNKNKLDLIATRLEFINSKATGKLLTKNCFGIEKVNRIKEKYVLEDYNNIYVYGDSSGDKEMLDIADEKFYKFFND